MTDLLQRRVAGHADRRPDAVAVVLGRQSLTYRELEERTNRLARILKEVGCEKGDRVGLLLPKSVEAIVGMLGALKADCAYVPIDTASPAARIVKILAQCEPRCLLASPTTRRLLEETLAAGAGMRPPLVGWMDERGADALAHPPAFSLADLSAVSDRPPDFRNDPSDMAHILFTSGSTGAPKGVMITHANVIHFVDWAISHFGTNREDRVSCHPPLHFDLSTFDIFGTFTAGAQLHLVPPELNLLPHRLADFIRDSRLTQWFSVPSLLVQMAKLDAVRQDDFPALKRLLWCGETFPTPSLAHWMSRLPGVSFTNLYGPTETTIASSYYRVPRRPEDDRAVIPIGTACDGEELLVLDESLRPAAVGEVGDLYIGGVGLSPGYWMDPEKTAAVFIDDPRGRNGERIYKTGDLARLGDDGLVYLVGRSDSQVKCRGYRIELGEIEAALNALDALRESAVVAIQTDGFEGTDICCAYAPALGAGISPKGLSKQLARVLPPYMLPARWMQVERLPRNANGKIDKTDLRQRFQARGPEAGADGDR